MLKKILFTSLIILFLSCTDSKNSNKSQNSTINKSVYNIKEDSVFIYDTTGKSHRERLNKLIEMNCLKRFDQSRTEFIDASTDSIYNIGQIVKKGGNYSYEVTSDVYQIGIKYNCIPVKGEYTMDVIGEDSIVDMYYTKIKLLTKWDNCNKIDGNESCNALKKIEPYPVKTYFKFDYIKMKNGMMHLSFFRKHLPELDASSN